MSRPQLPPREGVVKRMTPKRVTSLLFKARVIDTARH